MKSNTEKKSYMDVAKTNVAYQEHMASHDVYLINKAEEVTEKNAKNLQDVKTLDAKGVNIDEVKQGMDDLPLKSRKLAAFKEKRQQEYNEYTGNKSRSEDVLQQASALDATNPNPSKDDLKTFETTCFSKVVPPDRNIAGDMEALDENITIVNLHSARLNKLRSEPVSSISSAQGSTDYESSSEDELQSGVDLGPSVQAFFFSYELISFACTFLFDHINKDKDYLNKYCFLSLYSIE